MVSGWARRNDGGVTPSYLLQVRPFSCIVYTMLVWSYQIVQTIEREDAMLVPTEIEGKAYLTQREASKYLGIARETFRKHIAPELTEYKDPRRPDRQILYLRTDLDQYKLIQPRHDE